MHSSIINQCRHSVTERLNVSWSRFHSQSGNIKEQFAKGRGFTCMCSCYDPMMTLILSCTEVTQLYVTPETVRKFPFIMADKGRLHCGYTFCFFLLWTKRLKANMPACGAFIWVLLLKCLSHMSPSSLGPVAHLVFFLQMFSPPAPLSPPFSPLM